MSAYDRAISGDRCFCRACGEYFNSTKAFDKHRTGKYRQLRDPGPETRRCRSFDEMAAKGMSKNSADFWITSKMAAATAAARRPAAIESDGYPTMGQE